MKNKIPILKALLIGILLPLAGGYLLYDSFWPLLLTPLSCFLSIRFMNKAMDQKRRNRMNREFEIVMQSLAGDLQSGYSMDNAWKASLVTLKNARKNGEEPGEFELMMGEVCRFMEMNEPLEKLLPQLAEQTEDEDVSNFAEVYSYARRSGGNLAAIVERTALMMRDRRETEMDIQVLIASKKLEQRVMNIMPIFILAFLKLTSADYLDPLYHNLFGMVLMSVCAAVYGGILILSKRLMRIEV